VQRDALRLAALYVMAHCAHSVVRGERDLPFEDVAKVIEIRSA
jgi:hypothetical protein